MLAPVAAAVGSGGFCAGLVLWLCMGCCPAVESGESAGWRTAQAGWEYRFPEDHGSHPGFKTEWWYFTGNLQDDKGRRFGYQFTLFRQGLRPPGKPQAKSSRFLVDAFHFGHFAVSDLGNGRFHFTQRLSRGAFGEAGDGQGLRLAWLEDWRVEQTGKDRFRILARMEEGSLDLELDSAKEWVVHGVDGVSPKSEQPGHASHYYSGTRMGSRGELVLGGRSCRVRGESWFDHEWATNQLAPGQVGWNWLSLQLSDGSELMLYQMRLENGSVDPGSNGTWVPVRGPAVFLKSNEYRMAPVRYWKSEKTGARYPVEWEVEIPGKAVRMRVTTPMENQELVMRPVVYWEGAVDASGSAGTGGVTGRGYLEMTGYAGALVGLSAPAESNRTRDERP